MAYTAIEKMGIDIGSGVCGVLNKIRDASDRYDDYYNSKKDKGVFDHIVNAATSLGKGGVAIVKTAKKGFDTIAKSDIVQSLKSGIGNVYSHMRESYQNYLTDNQHKIDAEINGGKTGFSVGFKSFLNSMLQTAESVYSKGEGFVKNVADSLHTQKEGIKASDSYQKLVAARNEMDAKQSEKETEAEYSKV